jgi:hypothetical protein
MRVNYAGGRRINDEDVGWDGMIYMKVTVAVHGASKDVLVCVPTTTFIYIFPKKVTTRIHKSFHK